MSALFGLIRFDGGEVRNDELQQMAASLANHGQDGTTVWTDKHVGLGHVLRIITPEDRFERQPLRHVASKDQILFCGRLDNRAELLTQLSPFATDWSEVPDSVLASEAFHRWNSECINRLVGDYLMVVWQERDQQVLVLRGPLSDRTFFFYLQSKTLAFATSPLGLFALPFVPKTLDRERLADYALRTLIEPTRTFFEGIQTVQGGTITKIDSAGSRAQSIWQPDSLPEIRFNSDRDYEEAFLERFDLAVAARLRSAYPLAVMMSGGIDSSSIACRAAIELEKSGQRLHAFTQVPIHRSEKVVNGYYTDETPLVESIVRKYGNIDLHLVRTEAECVLPGHLAFIEAAGAPFRNMGNRPWMEKILEESQLLGARAVLTGALGNVAFSWRGSGVLPEMMRRFHFGKAWQEARAMNTGNTLRTFVGQGIVPLLPDPVWLGLMRLIHPENPQLSAKPPWSALSPLRREFEQAQRVQERARDKGLSLLWRPDHSSLPTRIGFLRLSEAFQPEINCGFEARHGVEQRDPTADRRVVEFCLSIPEDQFLKNGIVRSLPRRAMADRWPHEVAANTLRGLQNSDWHPLLIRTLPILRDTLDQISASSLAAEVLDLERIRNVLDTIDKAPIDSPKPYADTHHILYFGLGLGQFLQWIERG